MNRSDFLAAIDVQVVRWRFDEMVRHLEHIGPVRGAGVLDARETGPGSTPDPLNDRAL